jgi:hypothetical protein
MHPSLEQLASPIVFSHRIYVGLVSSFTSALFKTCTIVLAVSTSVTTCNCRLDRLAFFAFLSLLPQFPLVDAHSRPLKSKTRLSAGRRCKSQICSSSFVPCFAAPFLGFQFCRSLLFLLLPDLRVMSLAMKLINERSLAD